MSIGRKGSPFRRIKAGATIVLCDIQGPGTIRHIWMTTEPSPGILRGLVIRAYWEDQKHPSIEYPVDDFMGFAHGVVQAYHSAVHSVSMAVGMNIWLPMPFSKRARLTITNDGTGPEIELYYQIDYTLGDRHPNDMGRLHVLFRRENPTTLKRDFELLPKRTGKGRFIGSVIGVHSLDTSRWWGEGEVKVYLDGDTDFRTICGTGSEDYVQKCPM